MRRLIALASALSLLLCVGAVALWVRSYAEGDDLLIAWDAHYTPSYRANGVSWASSTIHPSLGIHSGRGGLCIGTGWGDWMDHRRTVQFLYKPSEFDLTRTHALFHAERYPRRRRFPKVPMFYVEMTDLIPVALLAILPSIWVIRLLRTRRGISRMTATLCASCGYDLRASTTQCPECGTTIPAQRAPAVVAELGTSPPLS
jgi:hypothetical protein